MTEYEFRTSFAKWLRFSRIGAGMSVIDLAARLNITVGEVLKWESANGMPNVYYYYLISCVFGKFEVMNG